MIDIIGKKKVYFLISALVIIPGLVSFLFWGLRFSIDFTGGSLLEVRFEDSGHPVSTQTIKEIVEKDQAQVASVQEVGDKTYLFRLKSITKEKNSDIQNKLAAAVGGKVIEQRFETVGPTIGSELTRKAIFAIAVASLVIIFYITLAFRKLTKPASPWRFGVTAIIALIHDVLVVVGIFSLLGHFYQVEIDSLFVTALLTVIGFSVHDTIVVFDRIRENLRKMAGQSFAEIVNVSIRQTLARSISTSATVVLTLFALLLFSSGSLTWFIVALLIGIISGTYSSIFNASPLLVVWQEWMEKKDK